jgi:hypothetical protein
MLTTSFRIIRLDITSPGKPLYTITEVTFDAENRPVAWRNGDVRFRGGTTGELLGVFNAVRAAFDSAILSERELNDQGVRMAQ